MPDPATPVSWRLPDFGQIGVNLGLQPSPEHYTESQRLEDAVGQSQLYGNTFTAEKADFLKGKNLIETGFNPVLGAVGAMPYQLFDEAFNPELEGQRSLSNALGQGWQNLRGIGSAVGERIQQNPWSPLSSIFKSQVTPKYNLSSKTDPWEELRFKAQSGFGFLDKPIETQAKVLGPLVRGISNLSSAADVFPLTSYAKQLAKEKLFQSTETPANIRAADRFFSGDTSPATNEFFTSQEMDRIKETAGNVLGEGRDYIEYGDWMSGSPWYADPDPRGWGATFDKVREPSEIMQTTFGGVGGYEEDTWANEDLDLSTHFPGLGIINKPVGPTGRYNEPHLTLRDVWDVNPEGQPTGRNPIYQALLNLGEHRTTTQGSEFGFPFDLDLGLASDYDIPAMWLGDTDPYELRDWENQSKDWYTPRYPTKETPPAVTWGEGNILQRAGNPNLSAVSQALTPYEIMSGSGYDSFSKTNEANQKYIQEALKHFDTGESEQEEQVQEIERKPREERSSVEEQVVVASKVRKALDNAAKGKKVKNEFRAITELAKTDPTIARRYTTPGSQDLIDITSQVESFASINKPRPGYGKPPRRPGGR